PSLFLGNSSLREVVAFDESRILIFDVTTENEFLSERKEYLKDDLELIYKLDSDILDKYWVRYIYFGEKERVWFSKTFLRKVGIDKLFSGGAEIFDIYPEVVYVLITVDTERDLPPVLSSYLGVEEGVPLILELLERYEVRATFFVTGEVMERYPEVISKILQNHEVGLHGMFHEDFTLLEKGEKRKRILMAQDALEGLSERAYSFRAPGHSADTELLNILEELGFNVEASAHRDISYPYHPSEKNWLIEGEMKILRIPLSHTPEYFYPSAIYDKSFTDAYRYVLESQKYKALKVVVIGVHSWEFVELEVLGHESYSKPSGEYTYQSLEELFKYLKHKNTRFLTVREFFEIWMSGRRDKV
ncbi:MAG: polysaccharide deacetylase family protein, partial [Candidatus Methanofastidiosia archaeon]